MAESLKISLCEMTESWFWASNVLILFLFYNKKDGKASFEKLKQPG